MQKLNPDVPPAGIAGLHKGVGVIKVIANCHQTRYCLATFTDRFYSLRVDVRIPLTFAVLSCPLKYYNIRESLVSGTKSGIMA